MDAAILPTTYTLIHEFLTKRSHSKAAEALRKAAKDVVVLKEGVRQDGPSLEEIVKEWNELKVQVNPRRSPETSSQDDSSSESSSDDSDSESTVVKKATGSTVVKKKASGSTTAVKKASKAETSSSSSESDSEEESKPVVKAPQPKKAKAPSSKTSSAPSSSSDDSHSDSSDSGSESDDESSDAEPDIRQKLDAKNLVPSESSRTLTSGDDSASGSDSDSDGGETSEGTPKQVVKKITKPESSSSDSESDSTSSSENEKMSVSPAPVKHTTDESEESSSEESSDSSSDSPSSMDDEEEAKAPLKRITKDKASNDVQPAKKRKTSENGSAVITATTSSVSVVSNGAQADENTPKGGRKSNTPFRRIDPSKISHDVLVDNRYEAKIGPTNDYGQRAHNDLIVTRGAGFRKEKSKKKRGSYRGGEITMESHSFKFT